MFEEEVVIHFWKRLSTMISVFVGSDGSMLVSVVVAMEDAARQRRQRRRREERREEVRECGSVIFFWS